MKNFSILALAAATMALSTKAIKIKALDDEQERSEIYFEAGKIDGDMEVYVEAEPGETIICDGEDCESLAQTDSLA